MKSSKINYFIVGCFVIAMVVGLVISVATLTGRTGATDAYYVVYKNVTGIKFGTQVLYEGYPIGQVEKVTPQDKDGRMQFRVDLSVTENWRIPDNSKAHIAAPGLLSALTISIAAGDSPTPLKPGTMIVSQEASNIFAVMSSVATEVTDLAQNSIKPMLATIDRAVNDFSSLLQGDGKGLIGDGKALIGDSQELLDKLLIVANDLSTRTPKIADDIENFAGRMVKISSEVEKVLSPDNRYLIETILADLGAATGNLNNLAVTMGSLVQDNKQDIDKSVDDMRNAVDSVSRHIDAINQNLEGAARNMYEFSRQIRQNPGLLLGGTPPKDQAVGQ